MTKLEELLEWMDDAEYAPSYGELRRKVKDLITEEQQVKSVDLAEVGGSLPSDEAKSWLKKYMDKKLMKNHPEYGTTENMVKYVFSKGWKMAKEQ